MVSIYDDPETGKSYFTPQTEEQRIQAANPPSLNITGNTGVASSISGASNFYGGFGLHQSREQSISEAVHNIDPETYNTRAEYNALVNEIRKAYSTPAPVFKSSQVQVTDTSREVRDDSDAGEGVGPVGTLPGAPDLPKLPDVVKGSQLWKYMQPDRGLDAFDPLTMYAENYEESQRQVRALNNYLPGVQAHGGNQFVGPGYGFNGISFGDEPEAGQAALQAYGKYGFTTLDELIGAAQFRDDLRDSAIQLQNNYDAMQMEHMENYNRMLGNQAQAQLDQQMQDYTRQLEQYYQGFADMNITGGERQRLELEKENALAVARQQNTARLEQITAETQGRLASERLAHESRKMLQEQEYDLKFQLQQIDMAFQTQQSALDRALEAENLIEVRRANQVMEALQLQKNNIQQRETQLSMFNMIANKPEILFFAGQQGGLLDTLGDIGGDGGQAVQAIMDRVNAMPAVDNLQKFSRLSGLEQGLESMRLGSLRGVSQEDLPGFLRGMAPRALLNPQDPNAPVQVGAPPLSGADYQSLLSQYTGQPGVQANLPGDAAIGFDPKGILDQSAVAISPASSATIESANIPSSQVHTVTGARNPFTVNVDTPPPTPPGDPYGSTTPTEDQVYYVDTINGAVRRGTREEVEVFISQNPDRYRLLAGQEQQDPYTPPEGTTIPTTVSPNEVTYYNGDPNTIIRQIDLVAIENGSKTIEQVPKYTEKRTEAGHFIGFVFRGY